ncbi:MAG: primosome assembly protein PriA, primosomal protein N' [Candidatus Peregrinibacteria bacterium GW2011_GWF2_39_17]|nr:MAG: primosome assembly protein PriA, primosomal protein N' [Candidatus Peregrinibacteria bacterium GW2011_GWF2_39_17]HCW32259.1 primosomal protein N' [Candidatus Peregrinibacteria bacterium]
MYAEITLPFGLGRFHSTLTYNVPVELQGKVELGKTVQVPLRNRRQAGIITELHDRKIVFRTKEILAVLEGETLLNPWQIELAKWIADYYFAPLYQVLKLMLPRKLWIQNPVIPYQIVFERATAPLLSPLGKKQQEVLNLFKRKSCLSRLELGRFSLITLRSLVKKGFLIERRGDILPLLKDFPADFLSKKLTFNQKAIVDGIPNSEEKCFLIHGVTGSGKTEIYLKLAQKYVFEGKQVIILVPEISLTPQLIDYFQHVFRDRLAVLHSHLLVSEKEREWWRIQTQGADVVIGPRSALFAPIKNLGLIVLDEEHEWSYKQETSPRYHAREVAFKISNLTGAKVLLGSATPSIETFYATEKGSIQKFTLPTRVDPNCVLPKIYLVDLRDELRAGNFSIFSNLLQEKLGQILKNNKQAILFLNRRGHASSVICRECGFICRCSACEVSFTHHKFKNGIERLVCHHCGKTASVPALCPSCGGVAIKFVGIGTQRIESELRQLFPTVRVLRADRDTTSAKGSFDRIYRAFKAHEADVLVGTQMIGKGLDLPQVTLVGVILADVGLSIPDFRSSERNFQLLTQVAGRSGRAKHPGEVVIQTYNPEYSSLKWAAFHDYQHFYEEEIKRRLELKDVPFRQVIKLIYRHENQNECAAEALRITNQLKFLHTDLEITCAPALIAKHHNKYYWHVYLQGENPRSSLKQFMANESLKPGWNIDVDPMVMS